MKKLCDRVLDKIKEEKISPRPRWIFLLRDCSVWSAFIFSVIVGSLAFCIILTVAMNSDWDIYQYLGRTPFQHIIFSLPYLWIIILILFFGLAYFNYKHTKKGYQYHAFTIFGLSILSSVVFGSIFSASGIGIRIDRYLDRNIPSFQAMNCCQINEGFWVQPEKGLLGGTVKNVTDERDFNLEDFNGFVWLVHEDENTLEFDPVQIRDGEEVKIIGEKERENVFLAKEIRPWQGRGQARPMRFRLDD
ncbi:MAG: hypothetical protein WC831_03420 [Parcubacteria group bacterium]|jgi:hypothetical protein